MTARNKLVEIERDQLHRWAYKINRQEISKLAGQIFAERETDPWMALLEDMRLLEQIASREAFGISTAVTRLDAAMAIVTALGKNGGRNVSLNDIGMVRQQ